MFHGRGHMFGTRKLASRGILAAGLTGLDAGRRPGGQRGTSRGGGPRPPRTRPGPPRRRRPGSPSTPPSTPRAEATNKISVTKFEVTGKTRFHDVFAQWGGKTFLALDQNNSGGACSNFGAAKAGAPTPAAASATSCTGSAGPPTSRRAPARRPRSSWSGRSGRATTWPTPTACSAARWRSSPPASKRSSGGLSGRAARARPAQGQHVGQHLVARPPRRGQDRLGMELDGPPAPSASSIAITTPSGVTAVTANPPVTCSGRACSE